MRCPECHGPVRDDACQACGWSLDRVGRDPQPLSERLRCTAAGPHGRCYLLAGSMPGALCPWHRRHDADHGNVTAFEAWITAQFRPGGPYGAVWHQFWAHEDLLWDAACGVSPLPVVTKAWQAEIWRRHREILAALRGVRQVSPGPRLTGLPGWDWDLDGEFERLVQIGRERREEAETIRRTQARPRRGFSAMRELVGEVVPS